MARVLCVLYDDPVDGYPRSYARDAIPRIDRYYDGQTTPTPSGSTSSRVSFSAAFSGARAETVSRGAHRLFPFRSICRPTNVGQVWSPLWSLQVRSGRRFRRRRPIYRTRTELSSAHETTSSGDGLRGIAFARASRTHPLLREQSSSFERTSGRRARRRCGLVLRDGYHPLT
jgi:hypothetical protein